MAVLFKIFKKFSLMWLVILIMPKREIETLLIVAKSTIIMIGYSRMMNFFQKLTENLMFDRLPKLFLSLDKNLFAFISNCLRNSNIFNIFLINDNLLIRLNCILNLRLKWLKKISFCWYSGLIHSSSH